MKHLRYAPLIAALILLSACASLALPPAQNFTGRLAYAYAQNTGAREAGAKALDAGKITADDARYTLRVTDEARVLIDAAGAAYAAGDVQSAEGRLTLVLATLDSINAYLDARLKQ